MKHLPLHYEQSMDWDEAMELILASAPELEAHLLVLDDLIGPDSSIADVPAWLHPVANLMFLLQTDPPTPSRH